MPRVIDPRTGATYEVAGATDLAEALAAGYQLADDSQGGVAVQTPGGREVEVEASELGDYTSLRPGAVGVDPGSLVPREAEAYRQAELQREHGGAGGQVGAFAEGIGNALTLGGYGALNEATGGNYAERAEANPIAHVSGEATGLVGTVLVPGGALKAAGSASKLGKAGQVLAKTPAGFVSHKATALAEAIGGLKGAAAGQALEGAIYATGQTLSDAYIHDKELTASALYSEVGRNALFGAGIGASGAALAHGLAKAGGRLEGVGQSGIASPVVDLASKEGRAAISKAAKPMSRLDDLTEDTIEVLEGRLPKKATVPDADEALIPPGVVSKHDLPTQAGASKIEEPPDTSMVPEAGRIERDVLADANSPAQAPLQRRKILKSVGDQVLDEGVALGTLAPKDIARLRKSYAQMDEAVTFARETGTKAGAAGASRALDRYELEVAQLAKKVGMDVGEQLDSGRRAMELVELPKAAKVADDAAAVPPSAPRAPDVPGHDYAAIATNLRSTRKLAKEGIGVGEANLLTGDAIRGLLAKSPDELLTGLSRIDDYFTALRTSAETLGDARLLRRVEKALDNVGTAIDDLTGGVRLGDVDRSIIADALKSESMAKAEFKNPAVAKLHEMSALTKITGDIKMPKGVTKKAAYNGLLMSASARAAARGASRLGNQVGGGGLGGALLGGGAAATAFKLIHSMGAVTGAATGRVARAVGTAAKHGSKAVRPATVTAAWLIRESRWDFSAEEGKKKTTAKSLHEAFKQRSAELVKVQANPDAAQAAIHNELAPLRKHAPYVADELEMLAISVPLYLADKMPKDPGSVMRWGKSNWRPSEYEILQFGEHMRGAVAPLETFESMMESGYITPQAAEAIRTLHKPLYNQMQQEVFMRADELRDKLDYQGQVRISVFFQVPVTSTMRPEFRAFMKERHALRAQQSSPTGQQMGPSSGSADAGEPLTGAQQLLKA